jgi:hypothetical protein
MFRARRSCKNPINARVPRALVQANRGHSDLRVSLSWSRPITGIFEIRFACSHDGSLPSSKRYVGTSYGTATPPPDVDGDG